MHEWARARGPWSTSPTCYRHNITTSRRETVTISAKSIVMAPGKSILHTECANVPIPQIKAKHITDLVSYVAWSIASGYSKTFLDLILYTLNYKHRILIAQLYTHRSQAIFYSRWSGERGPARAISCAHRLRVESLLRAIRGGNAASGVLSRPFMALPHKLDFYAGGDLPPRNYF